jgi:hypothetical protein
VKFSPFLSASVIKDDARARLRMTVRSDEVGVVAGGRLRVARLVIKDNAFVLYRSGEMIACI